MKLWLIETETNGMFTGNLGEAYNSKAEAEVAIKKEIGKTVFLDSQGLAKSYKITIEKNSETDIFVLTQVLPNGTTLVEKYWAEDIEVA